MLSSSVLPTHVGVGETRDAELLEASHLSTFDVSDIDALVLVQWDGLSSQQHLHGSGGDVLDGTPQHPAVPRAPKDIAPP